MKEILSGHINDFCVKLEYSLMTKIDVDISNDIWILVSEQTMEAVGSQVSALSNLKFEIKNCLI